MTKKNEIFAQTLLHKVNQQNEMGLVEKFYTVDVLTVYRTYLPKIINFYACQKNTNMRLPLIWHFATFSAYFSKVRISHIFSAYFGIFGSIKYS